MSVLQPVGWLSSMSAANDTRLPAATADDVPKPTSTVEDVRSSLLQLLLTVDLDTTTERTVRIHRQHPEQGSRAI